jgi:hypothetical protein
LRIAAFTYELNVFLIEPAGAAADAGGEEPGPPVYTCINPFQSKWKSVALYMRPPSAPPQRTGSGGSAPLPCYEVLRQTNSRCSVWEHSSPVVKV